MIKALLFDMDGVLLNSEELSIEIAIAYFRSLGYEVERGDFSDALGKGELEFFEVPARRRGITNWSYSDASSFFRREYPERLHEDERAYPGASEIFLSAKELGLLTAVVSSAPRWKVNLSVEACGLTGLPDTIISGEDITHNKPAPDIYLKAQSTLGVEGGETVVFEDSLSGIRSGLDAGSKVIAVLTTTTREGAEREGATCFISSIGDVSDIERLKALLKE